MKDLRMMSAEEYDDAVSGAIKEFREYLQNNKILLSCAAQIGDGKAGYLIEIMSEVLLPPVQPSPPAYKKAKIGRVLQISVFERDAYRCLRCGSWENLCADHVVPEVEGGEATLENMQTLCNSCNTWKGTKTIDFRVSE